MSLAKSAISWRQVAGLGISLVVAGQFTGWNYGLAAGGWANMSAATFLMAVFCFGLALCVAELSAALPHAGGIYTYAEAAFGPFTGYIVGFAVFTALTIGAGAAAEFISAYSGHAFGFGGWPLKAGIFAVILGLHIRGVGEALRWLVAAGVLAVISLLVFDLAMLPYFKLANLVTPASPVHLDARGVFACIPFAIWLFITIEQTAAASEEAEDPGRTMPKGIIAAISVLLLTALGVLVLATGAGGITRVGAADDPLYAAMTSTSALGSSAWLARVIGAGAVLGLLATLFSLIYSASRQLFALARDQRLPLWLGRTNRRGAPHVALLLVGTVGIAISAVRPEKILLAVVLLLSASYIVVLASFIRLRMTRPELHRPFRAWGGIVMAAICLLLSVLVFVACFQVDIEILAGLGITFGAAGGWYLFGRRLSPLPSIPSVER
jgi:ethanolamine permease